MDAVVAKLPESVKKPLRRFIDVVRSFTYHGNGRTCPVCGKSSSRFRQHGFIPRDDAQCVHCRALERHRLLWLFLNAKTNFFDGKPKRMLHIAPEICFEDRFKKVLGSGYLTADLFKPDVMVKMDITDIQYADQVFDVIYCSHVLEHVPDDRQAMREFKRVLKNDGWAILLVPVTVDKTFEDPSIVDPQERLRLFGQDDHVRVYGPDYVDRLRDVGFKVQVFSIGDIASREEAEVMGLTLASGDIYFCTK